MAKVLRLIEEIADDGGTVDRALELSQAATKMRPVIMTMTKQDQRHGQCLVHASSFMDGADVLLPSDVSAAPGSQGPPR